MNINDIFDYKENEYYVSDAGQRFCFRFSEKCRPYMFDGTLGVRLYIYFDNYNPDGIISNGTVWPSGANDVSTTPKLYVKVEALNLDTNQYERLAFKDEPEHHISLPFEAKKTFYGELILKPEHIASDSTVTVKLTYDIGYQKVSTYGFLRKHYSYTKYHIGEQTRDMKIVLSEMVGRDADSYNCNSEEVDDEDLDNIW